MKQYVGIWVDHKKAFIATLNKRDSYQEDPARISIKKILSEVERRTRLSGGSRTRKTPWGPQEIAVDRKIEERQKHQLRQFYSELIDILKGADKILILGPGEAKNELRKQIEKSAHDLTKRIVGVETCDKMTESQIAARVRAVFDK